VIAHVISITELKTNLAEILNQNVVTGIENVTTGKMVAVIVPVAVYELMTKIIREANVIIQDSKLDERHSVLSARTTHA
jgi:prevent-host-death family protein